MSTTFGTTPVTVLKDERGRTYLASLGKTISVDRYDDERASHVMAWFNRTTRDWVVSYGDKDGHQVGPSEYCGYREWAEESFADLYVNGRA